MHDLVKDIVTLSDCYVMFSYAENPEPGDWNVCSKSELKVSDIYIKTAVGYSMCTDGKSTPTITEPPPACEFLLDWW